MKIYLPIVGVNTMAPVTIIPAQFIKVNNFLHNDVAGTRIVCGIHIIGSEGIGEVYKAVNGVVTGPIAVTNALGKDDSISCVVDKTGTLICDVSEADLGGGGATCAGRTYTWPALLPAAQIVSGSSTVDTIARSAMKSLLNNLSSAASLIYTACQNILKTLP